MNEELRLNSEEEDALDSYIKFNERGDEYFYKEEYENTIENMENALTALEIYIPTNIKCILENLSHRLLFLGLKNELLLKLGISYRKLGYHYKARRIFEDLLYFAGEFRSNKFLGYEEMILGYYPIPRDELLRRVWNEIGLIYKDLKMYSKALDAFYKSTYNYAFKPSHTYHNPWLEIAYLHEQIGEFKKAKSAKRKYKKTYKLNIKTERRAQW